MIIIDYSSTAIATLTGGFMDELNTSDYEKVENIARHAILSTIKSFKKRFSDKFGDKIVIAVDNKHYWRRDYFSAYKHGRKKAREESGINWEFVHKAMDATKKDLIAHFPYIVIDVDGAEADDVIAVVSTTTLRQTSDVFSLFDDGEPEKTLVITTDKDMSQLLIHKHIKIWNPRLQKQITLDEKPEMFLKRLILTGDSGDAIPNVFSVANSFVDGIRQKPATEKKMQPLLDAKQWCDATTDQALIDRIEQNTVLIDFARIPKWVQQNIIAAYNQPNTKNKMDVMKYLISKDMKLMLKDLEQF